MFESGVSIVMLKGHVPESNATRNQLIPSVHIYIYINVRSIILIMSGQVFHISSFTRSCLPCLILNNGSILVPLPNHVYHF